MVVGIPLIAAALIGGWYLIRGQVTEHTGGMLKSVWADKEREHAAEKKA